MEYQIQKHIQGVKDGSIDLVEFTHKVLESVEEINDEYYYFNNITKDLAIEQAKRLSKRIINGDKKGVLLGLPVSLKDCICLKGEETRSGSSVLSGYKPIFNSYVAKRIIEEGGIIIGKTIQDEFGFGSFSNNVGIGMNIPLNPFDKERSCGGSSGGAAGITKKSNFPHVAIAESTGGSIACPASFCGVVGLTPTYGRVSRNGLIDYGNSLDKIGVMARTVSEAELAFNVISGHDKDDMTSVKIPHQSESNINKKVKIGLIKETMQGLEPDFERKIKEFISKTAHIENFELTEVSMPLNSRYAVATYYLIAMAEVSTNLAKYCGLRYGAQEEFGEMNYNGYFSHIREKNFGREAKRRIMVGTFARMAGHRDAYYLKALKARTLLIKEYKDTFSKVDMLLSPTMPILPPKFSEIKDLTPKQNYMMDIMTVGPNLAGLPHISLNCGYIEGLPIGAMLTANHLKEEMLIDAAKKLEER